MGAGNPPQLGKYELLARLATGGMAELFLARQSAIGGFSRVVVIKRILPHLADQPRFVEMFLEEARLASKLHHPNVVQILDVDQDRGNFFIAMEYIDGVSLASICRRSRRAEAPLSLDVASEIVLQACAGLHAAHELKDERGRPLGLVHRDVSPQNLMISRDGMVKLVDFGIAKAKDSAIRTRPGDVKGKTHYMSPEQILGKTVDKRSDLFSLGIIFFEMVSARRLFEGDSELATWKAITDDPLPNLRTLAPALPSELHDVMAHALSRDPGDRFADAAEMAGALRQVIEPRGLWTSPRVLATFVNDECREMLEARSLGSIDELSVLSASLPRLRGFDEGDDTSDRSRDLTRPGKLSASSSPPPPELRATSSDDDQPPPPPPPPPRPPSRRWRPFALLGAAAVVLIAVGLIVWHSGLGRGPSGPPLLFATPPSYSPETTIKGMEPLMGYLERRLDRPVEVVVTKDYSTLREKLRRGEVQVANMPPLLFVMARNDAPAPVPLVSNAYEGARSYQSFIVARDDAGISRVEELAGRRFCYVDRASTSGYLLPRHHLRSQGLDPDQLFSEVHFSGHHEKVLSDIVSGRCDAGAVYSNAFMIAGTLDVAASRLKLVVVAGDTPWDVICASPTLPAKEAAKIKRALLDLEVERDLGQRIISPIFRIDGFVEPHLDDFEGLEAAARAEGLL